MDNISQNEKLSTIVKALDSKRAEDIRIIEIGDLTIVADYFVIANGTSSTQTKALAEEATEVFLRLSTDLKSPVADITAQNTRALQETICS